jgi:RNA polymerase sigma factor (sigma-70 family)
MTLHNGVMSDVTRILAQIDSGDPQAAAQLLPLVYDELRKLAASKLAQEKPGQTLQATALVHEAYLRLVGSGQGAPDSGRGAEGSDVEGNPSSPNPEPRTPRQSPPAPDPQPPAPPAFNSRGHFFAAAAEAMRRILVDNARRKKSQRGGGAWERQELEALEVAMPEIPEDVLALDEALTKLAVADRAAADLVHLRFFAGLSLPEAAQILGISPRTADRLWAYARAWLHQEVQGSSTGGNTS